jgi:translation elongation factor EF-1alpha
MEPYEYYPQLGRFKLYKDGRTVAVGKILQIIE